MIVRADLDAAQAAAFRVEAARQGCSVNELARRILTQHVYAKAVADMDPARQPTQHVGENWL